jgi:hypothetical protein
VEHEAGVGGGVGDADADEAGGEVGVLDEDGAAMLDVGEAVAGGQLEHVDAAELGGLRAAGRAMVPVPTR